MLDLISQTTAGLDQLRHQWQTLLAPAATDATPGRLVEVTDLEPVPGQLRMLTYVPADLPAQAPLVVVLHGCIQTAEATITAAAGRPWPTPRLRACSTPSRRAATIPIAVSTGTSPTTPSATAARRWRSAG